MYFKWQITQKTTPSGYLNPNFPAPTRIPITTENAELDLTYDNSRGINTYICNKLVWASGAHVKLYRRKTTNNTTWGAV